MIQAGVKREKDRSKCSCQEGEANSLLEIRPGGEEGMDQVT